MIPGVVASQVLSSGGGNSYVASAVNFDGSTALICPHFSCQASGLGLFAWCGWFKTVWHPGYPQIFSFDPITTGQPYATIWSNTLYTYVEDAGSSSNNILGSASEPPLVDSTWLNLIAAFDSHNGKGSIMLNGSVLSGGDGGMTATGAAFDIPLADKDLWIGNDNYPDPYSGDMADISMWTGVDFFHGSDIDPAIAALFIDGNGKPIDPTIAIHALGTPSLMLTGGASNFTNNAGDCGTISVLEGSLTDASTAP